MMMICITDVIA